MFEVSSQGSTDEALEFCGYFVEYDRAVSEVVVRFALSVFLFGLHLLSCNLGCLTFPFDVCFADHVSSCGVRVPFPALGRTRYRAWSWKIVPILSTSPSLLWCRISACLLASSVRSDPFAEHLTRVQNPGGWALQLHGDFCSRVQVEDHLVMNGGLKDLRAL